MNWKLIAAVAAAAGGVLWAKRCREQRAESDATLWAEATDPVARFGQT